MKFSTFSKNNIRILIALMTIALFGIIIVQISWMRNAIHLKREALNQTVDEILYASVLQYDNQRRLNLFERTNNTDSIITIVPKHMMRSQQNVVVTQKVSANTNNAKVPPPPVHFQEIIVQSNDSNIQIFSTDTNVVDIRKIQGHFPVKVQEIVEHTANQLEDMEVFFQRWNQEYFYSNVMQRVNPKVLERILTKEMKNRNLDYPFEFGIVSEDSLLYSSNPTHNKAILQSTHTTRLFPNDIFQQSSKLLVAFTNNNKVMLANFGSLLLLSGFFTLAIIVLFSYSVHLILQQKKLSEMKSDFINNMTHEFKTPLATISLAADSIGNAKVISNQEKVNYFLQMIKKENLRMNNQVERILQVARLEREDLQLHLETVDIHDLLMNCIDTFKLSIEHVNGQITHTFKATKSFLEIDQEHIFNVFKNLIDNAIKYSSGEVNVQITTTNTPDGILISVSDKGIGMTKKVLSQIFEKFYREQHGNVHNVKGHGLGLSYAKQIITLHNGDIKVDSQIGKGSTFSVFLPTTKGGN